MALDSNKIKGVGGNLYAHVFENSTVGVTRELYWAMTINCEPIKWNGEEWPCSVTCEWLRWPVHKWEELDGMTLDTVLSLDEVECSLYLAEHNPVDIDKLSLERIPNKHEFLATISGTLELDGFDELDGEDISFSVQGNIVFEGIFLLPDNLSPKPSTAVEASDIVSKFIALETLKEPKWDRFRYIYEPS